MVVRLLKECCISQVQTESHAVCDPVVKNAAFRFSESNESMIYFYGERGNHERKQSSFNT